MKEAFKFNSYECKKRIKFILAVLQIAPSTVTEVSKAVGNHDVTSYTYLNHMAKEGMVHISSWQKSTNNWKAIYSIGPGERAIKPTIYNNRSQAGFNYKKELRENDELEIPWPKRLPEKIKVHRCELECYLFGAYEKAVA